MINIKKELLEDFRKNHNMTLSQFCKFCDISTGTYRKLLSGKTVRVKIISNICVATKITCFDLLGV